MEQIKKRLKTNENSRENKRRITNKNWVNRMECNVMESNLAYICTCTKSIWWRIKKTTTTTTTTLYAYQCVYLYDVYVWNVVCSLSFQQHFLFIFFCFVWYGIFGMLSAHSYSHTNIVYVLSNNKKNLSIDFMVILFFVVVLSSFSKCNRFVYFDCLIYNNLLCFFLLRSM